MKSSERQKICLQCDGRIPVEAVQCVYCGADAVKLSESSSFSKHQALEESLTSLYKPQYSSKSMPSSSLPPEPPKIFEEVKRSKPSPSPLRVQEEENNEGVREAFWSIFSLSLGSVLLTLSLLQLFFAEDGKLVLEWNARYWFLYALISFPLLYIGIKKLGRK